MADHWQCKLNYSVALRCDFYQVPGGEEVTRKAVVIGPFGFVCGNDNPRSRFAEYLRKFRRGGCPNEIIFPRNTAEGGIKSLWTWPGHNPKKVFKYSVKEQHWCKTCAMQGSNLAHLNTEGAGEPAAQAYVLSLARSENDRPLPVMTYSRMCLLWLPPRILITTMILRSWPSIST